MGCTSSKSSITDDGFDDTLLSNLCCPVISQLNSEKLSWKDIKITTPNTSTAYVGQYVKATHKSCEVDLKLIGVTTLKSCGRFENDNQALHLQNVEIGLLEAHRMIDIKKKLSDIHSDNCIYQVLGVCSGVMPEALTGSSGSRISSRVIVAAIAMKAERNDSLQEYIHNSNVEINTLTKLQILHKIATAVMNLHSIGVTHGNLKTCNTYLTDDSPSQVRFRDIESFSAIRFKHARTNRVNPYLAPELMDYPFATNGNNTSSKLTSASDNTVPHKPSKISDMYAYAIVAHEVLTRTTPFERYVLQGTLATAIHLNIRPTLSDLPDDTPYALRVMLTNCWDSDPSKRLCAAECVMILHQCIRALQTGINPRCDVYFNFFISSTGSKDRLMMCHTYTMLIKMGYEVWYNPIVESHDSEENSLKQKSNCEDAKVLISFVDGDNIGRQHCILELNGCRTYKLYKPPIISILLDANPNFPVPESSNTTSEYCINFADVSLEWECDDGPTVGMIDALNCKVIELASMIDIVFQRHPKIEVDDANIEVEDAIVETNDQIHSLEESLFVDDTDSVKYQEPSVESEVLVRIGDIVIEKISDAKQFRSISHVDASKRVITIDHSTEDLVIDEVTASFRGPKSPITVDQAFGDIVGHTGARVNTSTWSTSRSDKTDVIGNTNHTVEDMHSKESDFSSNGIVRLGKQYMNHPTENPVDEVPEVKTIYISHLDILSKSNIRHPNSKELGVDEIPAPTRRINPATTVDLLTINRSVFGHTCPHNGGLSCSQGNATTCSCNAKTNIIQNTIPLIQDVPSAESDRSSTDINFVGIPAIFYPSENPLDETYYGRTAEEIGIDEIPASSRHIIPANTDKLINISRSIIDQTNGYVVAHSDSQGDTTAWSCNEITDVIQNTIPLIQGIPSAESDGSSTNVCVFSKPAVDHSAENNLDEPCYDHLTKEIGIDEIPAPSRRIIPANTDKLINISRSIIDQTNGYVVAHSDSKGDTTAWSCNEITDIIQNTIPLIQGIPSAESDGSWTNVCVFSKPAVDHSAENNLDEPCYDHPTEEIGIDEIPAPSRRINPANANDPIKARKSTVDQTNVHIIRQSDFQGKTSKWPKSYHEKAGSVEYAGRFGQDSYFAEREQSSLDIHSPAIDDERRELLTKGNPLISHGYHPNLFPFLSIPRRADKIENDILWRPSHDEKQACDLTVSEKDLNICPNPTTIQLMSASSQPMNTHRSEINIHAQSSSDVTDMNKCSDNISTGNKNFLNNNFDNKENIKNAQTSPKYKSAFALRHLATKSTVRNSYNRTFSVSQRFLSVQNSSIHFGQNPLAKLRPHCAANSLKTVSAVEVEGIDFSRRFPE